MKQTIEERAYKAVPDMLRINDNYVASFVSGYCRGATEQKRIDEEQSAKELLYAVDKTAERTRKEVIDKANKWLRTHLPRVISNYPRSNGTTVMLNEDMRVAFREEMEKEMVL